jgi:hypothetical protein
MVLPPSSEPRPRSEPQPPEYEPRRSSTKGAPSPEALPSDARDSLPLSPQARIYLVEREAVAVRRAVWADTLDTAPRDVPLAPYQRPDQGASATASRAAFAKRLVGWLRATLFGA